MAVAATKGRFRSVIERLKTWIESALVGDNYDEYYVTNDYTNLPNNTSTMPYVTIKLSSGSIDDETYGRVVLKDGSPDTQGDGSFAIYFFTLFVYDEKCTDDGENENLYSHRTATTIMDYIVQKDQDETEKVDYGIERVYDVSGVESEPAGLWDLSRMIVGGTLKVKRLDSP
jgi:hypothetical protein